MHFDPAGLRAIIFDFGNTLVPFGRAQLKFNDTCMIKLLEARFGPVDRAAFDAIRRADRMAPYGDGFRENHLPELFRRHVRQLFRTEADVDTLREMARVRFEAFVESIEAPLHVYDLLHQLRARYRIGILSNYPDGEAIRASLRKIGWVDLLDAVVVSGDLGLVKPHPVPFQTVLNRLDVRPEQALHVGDNWLADVQGAKRTGLRACYFTQWTPPEQFDGKPDDLPPDLTIERLEDLLPLLLPA